VHLLAEVGAYGVNFHDNDLVPIDATPAERDQIVRTSKRPWKRPVWWCPWRPPTCSTDPVFKDGAFTANDPKVRAYALQKTMRAIDLGAELGARCTCSGAGAKASKPTPPKTRWRRQALPRCAQLPVEYVRDQGYDMKFALEAKPNEPRGDIYLPTTGAMLGFIATLDHP
jgi:xylose isomerase